MTLRVYLAGGRFLDGPPEPGDLPAERVFVHASDVPELWVETESESVPAVGKSISFALALPLGLGFERITGIIERRVRKSTRQRENTVIAS